MQRYERVTGDAGVQGSEAWKELRRKFFPSSKVAALFGVSPHDTALEVYEEMALGREKAISDYQRGVIFQKGHDAEAATREWVKANLGLNIEQAVLISKSIPLLTSLDGFDESAVITLEVKYVGAKAFAEARAMDKVKPHHELQMQAQMLVTGAKQGYHFVASDSGDVHYIIVQENPEMQNEIATAVMKFMMDLHSGKAPEPSDRDWQLIEDARLARIAELDRVKKAAESEMEQLKNAVSEEYQGVWRMRGHGVSMSRSNVRGSVDYKKIPQLKGVDLDRFRSAAKVVTTFRVSKESA